MICTSGGRSYHAWVRVDCHDRQTYDHKVASICRELDKFRDDTTNGDPARYSRLPGFYRGLGAMGAGEQRLVYLNPGFSTEEPISRSLSL
jgi:hypothetical protein